MLRIAVNLSCAVAFALSLSACHKKPADANVAVSMLPNGMKKEASILPSGKRISRLFGPDGSLLEETWSHAGADGKAALLLKASFDHGKKTGEMYVAGGHVVAREVYEHARVSQPDMPAADPSVPDTGASNLRHMAEDNLKKKLGK